jgi:hypothetical protein
MIQRIQSVYLLLTIILSSLFLKGDFLKFINTGGSEITMNLSGAWQQTAGGEPELILRYFVLSAIIIIIPFISVAAILTFRKRRLQMGITTLLIVSAVVFAGLLIYYGIYLSGKYKAEILPGFKSVIPLLILVLSILAFRGIKKDETIVKSYDRLR